MIILVDFIFNYNELIQYFEIIYSFTSKGTQPCLGPIEKGYFNKKGGLHKFWFDTFNFNDHCHLAILYWCFLSGNLVQLEPKQKSIYFAISKVFCKKVTNKHFIYSIY